MSQRRPREQAGLTIAPRTQRVFPSAPVARPGHRPALLVVVLAAAIALGLGASPALAVEDQGEVDTTSTTVPDETSTTTTSSTTTTLGDGEGEVDPDPTTTVTSGPTTTTTEAPVVTTRPPTSAPSTSDISPLIVAGPPDGRRQIIPDPEVEAAVDTITPVEPEALAPAEDDAERMIRLVVLGLVAVAVLLAALAVYYWWITRPPPLASQDDLEPPGGTPTRSVADDTVDPWLTDSTSTR